MSGHRVASTRIRRAMWRMLAMLIAIVSIGVIIIDWQNDRRLPQPGTFDYPHTSAVAGQATVPPIAAIFWEVGVSAGPDARDATAMRTTIRTVLPHHFAAHTTDFFWIGSYLSDGSFVQVGYAVSWSDRTAHWFYCSFGLGGTPGPCKIGPSSSAGAAGQMHTYALVARPASQNGQWSWLATFDGKTIGTMLLSAGSTGLETPAIYVEQSAFVATEPLNDLGPAEFSPAIEISHASAGTAPSYVSPQHAFAMASSIDACGVYGVRVLATNDVEIGSQLPCLAIGQQVW
jgi:hypothetical protein